MSSADSEPSLGAPAPAPPKSDEPASGPGGFPLYVWVIVAVVLGIPAGWLLGENAQQLELLPKIILRALTALAAPLVVFAILTAIVVNEVRGRLGALMMVFYLINTLVAMLIGLGLTNLIEPGKGASFVEPGAPAAPLPHKSASELIVDLVPRSIGEPFTQNHLAQLVLLTLAFGIGLVKLRDSRKALGQKSFDVVADLLKLGFELLMKVLLWVVAIAPFAVFGIVASTVGDRKAMAVLGSLFWLIVVVVAGVALQVAWYLFQLFLVGRISPWRFLHGALDVMASTLSTSSTAATIPITLDSLKRLGISRRSRELTVCIGTNFNNDGTALYMATAVLFMAQALDYELSLLDQILIMLTTLVASVGAGGIPSGSFVTMPLVFGAVRLPAEKIPILLTIDWLLDRCRTTSNVLGDMTVAVLLDRVSPPGHVRESEPATPSRPSR
jgi:DAACS family dicarboxylate/amino acid:cation (Na+ or H+) symporter